MQYISFLPFTTLGRGISCINHSNRGRKHEEEGGYGQKRESFFISSLVLLPSVYSKAGKARHLCDIPLTSCPYKKKEAILFFHACSALLGYLQ